MRLINYPQSPRYQNKTQDEYQEYRQRYVSESRWRYVGMSPVNYGPALSVWCNTPQSVLIPQHSPVHVCVLHTPVIIIIRVPLHPDAAWINAPHLFLNKLISISTQPMSPSVAYKIRPLLRRPIKFTDCYLWQFAEIENFSAMKHRIFLCSVWQEVCLYLGIWELERSAEIRVNFCETLQNLRLLYRLWIITSCNFWHLTCWKERK